MAGIVEKRRFKRFKFQEEVRVFPVLPSSPGGTFEVQRQSFETRSFDISEGGLRMEWAGEIQQDLLLKLSFKFSEDVPVEIYAKMVWCDGGRCGVKFMVPDAAVQHGVRALAGKSS